MMTCDCEEMVRRERRRCKEMVMAVVDRLGLEEKMHAEVRKLIMNDDEDINNILDCKKE